MALSIKILDDTNEKAWDDLVLSSSHSTIFHTVAWLRLAEEQADTELLPCMLYKGSQLVAIYPIFLQKRSIIKIALSPPSNAYMIYLGPVIAEYDSLKQDKKESMYHEIQKEMDNYIFNIKGCKYARIRSSPGLYDSRPLIWSGYTVEPYYTYRIDLTKGIDYAWEHFDGNPRRSITKAIKKGITVRMGDKEDIEFIHDSLHSRYMEQGLKTEDYKSYLEAIYQKFYPDNLKIFVAEYNGQKIGGTFNLCFKNIMYFWVGLPKTEVDGISPNDLIQWEAMKWAQANGLDYYEEMDAGDDPRLIYFKSKYNPDLVIWYSAVKYSSFIYKIGENLFNIIKKRSY